MIVTEKLAVMDELKKILPSILSPLEAFHEMSEVLKNVTYSDRVTLFAYDPEIQMLASLVAQGLETTLYLELGQGIVGQCALKGEAIAASDVDDDHTFHPDVDMTSGYITYNTLAVPILDDEGTLLGVFQLLNKELGNYDATDIRIASIMAKMSVDYLKASASSRPLLRSIK